MRDLRFLGVLACFLLSGFAGLLYQTAWSRHFSFAFGTSSLAVATVLAAYMGGMAGGAALAARFVDKVRRPLLVYGVLEAGIALSALAVPWAVQAAGWLRAEWLRGPELPGEGGLGTAGFYLVVSFVVLCVPTGLMGATLPLLTRHAVREEAQIGRRVGALYTINTVGAVVGTLCTAFWLLPTLGLGATVWVGVATNGLVLVLAWLLARRASELAPGRSDAPASPEHAASSTRTAGFLAIAFGAGIASFSFEVLWTRLLEHVLGGSVYAFATMLASFLAGIALGAAVASRLATSPERAARGLAVSQVGAGALALVAYALAQRLPELASALDTDDPLGRLLLLSAYGAGILLPSTLCIGATFPFAVRAITRRPEASARASARVYAWNTLGAIVGAVGAGFFVIPWLGFEGTVRASVALNLALGLGAALLARPIWRSGLALACAGAATLVWMAPAPPWSLLQKHERGLASVGSNANDEVVYFGVGRSATVLMQRGDQAFRLWSNGLPEAKIGASGQRPGMALTARWLGALPALGPGGSSRLLVIGLGGGVALESVPPSTRRIDVIELESEVVEANRVIAGWRASNPLADPRVRIHVNDARGALQLTDARWDAIVSQPSHPWTAGASHLYTREFHELVKSRLTENGVFVQWIGPAFIDQALLRSLTATLLATFAHVRAYDTGGLLFLASDAPLPTPEQEAARIAAEPDAFGRLGIRVPEDLALLVALDEVGTRRIAEGAPLIEDDDNLLANRSPLLIRAKARLSVRELLKRHDPLLVQLAELDGAYLTRRLLQMGKQDRARRLVNAIASQAEHLAAQAELHLANKRRRPMIRALVGALARDPSLDGVRFRLVQIDAKRDPSVAAGLSEGSRAVLAATAHRHRERWAELAQLDAALASVPPRHPAFDPARELRIAWRLHVEGASAEQALALTEADAYGWGPVRHGQRARAAALAGRSAAALYSLRELAKAPVRRGRRTAAAGEDGLAALDLLPAEALTATERVALARKLRRFVPAARSEATADIGAGP